MAVDDSLPEAQLGFRLILFQVSFVNQAFLGLQFFQVQGRNLQFKDSYFMVGLTLFSSGLLFAFNSTDAD